MTPKSRILIVDDDPVILLMLEKVLEADGCEVHTATNGDGAIRRARLRRYDLFVIDLIMPCRDGIETILALRAFDKQTPIIAMSGGWNGGSNNCLPLAEKIGASATLVKPFGRDTILSIVRRELRGPGLIAS